jgi:hypothetical protein
MHLGTWEGTDNSGNKVNMTLYEDNHLKLIFNDEILMSKEEITSNGERIIVKYEINYDEDPIWFDFVSYKNGEADRENMKRTALNFISEEEMEMVPSEDGDNGIKRKAKIDKNDKNYTLFRKVK